MTSENNKKRKFSTLSDAGAIAPAPAGADAPANAPTIPIDCLSIVLSFLCMHDVIRTANVCRDWHRCVDQTEPCLEFGFNVRLKKDFSYVGLIQSVLRRHVDHLADMQFCSSSDLYLLRQCENLTWIDSCKITSTTNGPFSFPPRLTTVTNMELHLHHNPRALVSKQMNTFLETLVKQAPHIQTLNLSIFFPYKSDDTFKYATSDVQFDLLLSLVTLTNLTILFHTTYSASYDIEVDDDHIGSYDDDNANVNLPCAVIPSLVKVCHSHPTLQHFSVCDKLRRPINMPVEFFNTLAATPMIAPLRTIDLSHTVICNGKAEAIQKLTSLRTFEPQSINCLSLAFLIPLTQLRVFRCHTSLPTERLLEGFQSLPMLTDVTLSHKTIISSDVAKIVTCIPRLISLELNDCKSMTTLESVCVAMPDTLTVFRLIHCRYLRIGELYALRLLSHLSHLHIEQSFKSVIDGFAKKMLYPPSTLISSLDCFYYDDERNTIANNYDGNLTDYDNDDDGDDNNDDDDDDNDSDDNDSDDDGEGAVVEEVD